MNASLVAIAMGIKAKCPLLPDWSPKCFARRIWQPELKSVVGGGRKARGVGSVPFPWHLSCELSRRERSWVGFITEWSSAQSTKLISQSPRDAVIFLGGSCSSEGIQDLGSKYWGHCILIPGLNNLGANYLNALCLHFLLCQVENNNSTPWDFPGGPVVGTLCFHCMGHGFDPWSGN